MPRRRQHGLRAVVDGLRAAVSTILMALAVFLLVAAIGIGLVAGNASVLVLLAVVAAFVFLSGRIAP